MRFRRSLLLGAFAVAVLLARQGVMLLAGHSPAFEEYRSSVDAHGIEPAALFYTESRLALRAEKEVRRRTAGADGK